MRSKPRSIEESQNEAAEQYYGKMAKTDVAIDAVMADHIDQISEAEIDAVNRYREMKVFSGDGKKLPAKDSEKGEDSMNRRRFIVCDDYHIQYGSIEPKKEQKAVLPWLVAGAIGLGSLGLGGYVVDKMVGEPIQAISADTDTDTIIRLKFGDAHN